MEYPYVHAAHSTRDIVLHRWRGEVEVRTFVIVQTKPFMNFLGKIQVIPSSTIR
jgi:hypothetical protein